MSNPFRTLLDTLVLLESTQSLNEDSPLLKAFGRDPLSTALAKHIHSKYKLSHAATPTPYSHRTGNLSLQGDLDPATRKRVGNGFKHNPDNFYVFKGSRGWAAIKPNYEGTWTGPDNTIPYVAYFALEDSPTTKDGDVRIGVKELNSKRGGLYTRAENRGVPNIADEVRQYIGDGRLEVWLIPAAGSESGMSSGSIDREKIAARRSEADPVATTTQVIGAVRAALGSKASATATERLTQLQRVLSGGTSPALFRAWLRKNIPDFFAWADEQFDDDADTGLTAEQLASRLSDSTAQKAAVVLLSSWAAGTDTVDEAVELDEGALSVEKRAQRAFDTLKKMGVPVYHFGGGWSGNALFTISGEQNYDETWADYYEHDFGEFGVNPKIIAVLDRYKLSPEWANPGVLEVYDNDY